MNVNEKFAQVMRGKRAEQRLKQEDVAEAMRALGFAKMHRVVISQIETGHRPVKLDEALGLAQVLEFNLPIALDDQEDDPFLRDIPDWMRSGPR